MGRKGSKLIPFLKNALFGDKYINLKFEGNTTNIFSLNFPRSSPRLGKGCQMILKDWCSLKGRKYKFLEDYGDAKQTLESALRNSNFLKIVQSGRNKKFIYRILESEEIDEKKSLKKAQKKAKKLDPYANSEYAPSPESSGYGSGSDNIDEICDGDGNHALLHALNHDHKYEMGHALVDESMQPMQLGYLEEPPPPNENLFFENALPFDDLERFFAPGPVCQNPFGNLHFSSLQDYSFPDETDASPLQDEDGVDLNPTLILNPEQAKLVDECLKNLKEECLTDVEENSVESEISTASGLDITSYKTKIVKVYEFLHRQDLPGMIMLTCEPKFKEFCVSDTNENEPSTPRLIFDEATMHLVSNCTLEKVQFLPNDHLLVFLQCKELF